MELLHAFFGRYCPTGHSHKTDSITMETAVRVLSDSANVTITTKCAGGLVDGTMGTHEKMKETSVLTGALI